jgi:hypothetical protein
MDQSSNMLVNDIQEYVKNLSFQSTNSSNYFTSTPSYEQSKFLTPNNTQILFSNNYCDITQQNSSIITNYSFDYSINQPQHQQQQHQQQQKFRPITKRISNESSSLIISPPSSEISSSSFESPNMSFNRKYGKERHTPKKALPIRSETVDLTEHIENAKKLKQISNKVLYCTFCKNNGEKEEVYCSHLLKDSTGKITCPVLKTHVCPICHETGEKAHTLTYCKDFKKARRNQFLH